MNSQALILWGIAYLLPAALTAFFASRFFRARHHQYLVIHIGLLVSVVISLLFVFWQEPVELFAFNLYPFVLYVIALGAGAAALGRAGFFYGISALIQQLCMQSVVLLLLPHIGNLVLILLIVPIYVFYHLLTPHKWHLQVLFTFIWGVISVLMFVSTKDIFLVSTIHAGGGVLLMMSGILYPWSELRAASQ